MIELIGVRPNSGDWTHLGSANLSSVPTQPASDLHMWCEACLRKPMKGLENAAKAYQVFQGFAAGTAAGLWN